MSLQVKVITPEKIIWNTESDEVVLPTVTGDLGVLTGHAPLVSVLEAGLLRKKSENGWTPLILFGGFAEVEDNQVIILGNGAEEIESGLSKTDAEEMLITASDKFEQIKLTDASSEEIDAASLEVQIAEARVSALNLLPN
jgi:F-type H+-transporting ATPase subunit epsilon